MDEVNDWVAKLNPLMVPCEVGLDVGDDGGVDAPGMLPSGW